MRDFAVHWSGISPTIDLYGVVVQGAAPYSDSPLLQADAIHVGVTVTSLLHKAWYVSDVRIERPVVRIFADRDGRTNLPPPKQEKPGAQAKMDIFDLGIRHLAAGTRRDLLQQSQKRTQCRSPRLDAAVGLRITDEKLLRDAFISRRTSSVTELQSIEHNFNAHFVATPEEFKLEGAELNAGSSRLSVVANVHDYSQPQVHATYEATIDAGEFRRALKNGALPTGIVQSSASSITTAGQRARSWQRSPPTEMCAARA